MNEHSWKAVSFEEIYGAFVEMQKARNEAISPGWVPHYSKFLWYKGKVQPEALVTPYSEFRGLVHYSRRGLTNAQALQEILQTKNGNTLAILSRPLTSPPPVIVWKRPDGVLQLDDGCGRSLAACHQGIKEVDAFIGIPQEK